MYIGRCEIKLTILNATPPNRPKIGVIINSYIKTKVLETYMYLI